MNFVSHVSARGSCTHEVSTHEVGAQNINTRESNVQNNDREGITRFRPARNNIWGPREIIIYNMDPLVINGWTTEN